MEDQQREVLRDAVDRYVAQAHGLRGYADFSRREDWDAWSEEPGLVYIPAGADAEDFCISEEGQDALRRIFGAALAEQERDEAREAARVAQQERDEARQLAADLWASLPTTTKVEIFERSEGWVPAWVKQAGKRRVDQA